MPQERCTDDFRCFNRVSFVDKNINCSEIWICTRSLWGKGAYLLPCKRPKNNHNEIALSQSNLQLFARSSASHNCLSHVALLIKVCECVPASFCLFEYLVVCVYCCVCVRVAVTLDLDAWMRGSSIPWLALLVTWSSGCSTGDWPVYRAFDSSRINLTVIRFAVGRRLS